MFTLCFLSSVLRRGVCTKAPCYCILMDFCPNGNLYTYIHSLSKLTPQLVIRWSRDIANGMAYLHSKRIIHRDLKSLK